MSVWMLLWNSSVICVVSKAPLDTAVKQVIGCKPCCLHDYDKLNSEGNAVFWRIPFIFVGEGCGKGVGGVTTHMTSSVKNRHTSSSAYRTFLFFFGKPPGSYVQFDVSHLETILSP